MAVGQSAGMRVHASHLWGAPTAIEAAFRAAEAAGVTVSYDMYPYRKSSTILAALLLPAELQAGGPEQTMAALADPAQRAALLAGEKFTEDYLQTSTWAACLTSRRVRREVSGSAAEGSGARPGEWVLDLLLRTRSDCGRAPRPAPLTDDHLAWLALDERHCAGSDGIYQGQHPHPRGYGAFSRLASYYLADGARGRLPALARHLAANAAEVYGLQDRGRLAPGMAADICVIGPSGIVDRAIYRAPEAEAAGVNVVLVNGVIVWRDGRPVTGRFPGQFVN